MIRQAYALVMNESLNPLRNLPKIVSFQIMTSLALMWSVVFCVWSGLVVFIGPSMAVHAVLLIGIYFTSDIFKRFRTHGNLDHRRLYRDPRDNGVLYDDIWCG